MNLVAFKKINGKTMAAFDLQEHVRLTGQSLEEIDRYRRQLAPEPGMPEQVQSDQHCNDLKWSNVDEHGQDQREDDDDRRSSRISPV